MNKDIIIIGAPRCGTTSLFNWLDQHPSVCGSTPKEPQFFETEYHNGPAFFYNKYFPDFNVREHDTYLTARPQLSWVGFCAQRVKNVAPDAKIIMMVRNPIERAYSGWKLIHDMRPGREPLGFEDFIAKNYECLSNNKFDREEDYIRNLDPKGGCYLPNVIEAGMYHHNAKRYIDLYGENAIIIDFHKMIKSRKSREWVVNFILGTENFGFYDEKFLQEENWYRPQVTKKMDAHEIKYSYPETYELLRRVYSPDVVRLGRLIGTNILKEWEMEE